MTANLTGKRAVVIGAASGIGRAVATKLAAAGAELGVLDKNADGVQQLHDELGDRSQLALEVDVCDFASVRTRVDEAVAALGGLDIMINTVGWNSHSFFVDQEESYWYYIVSLNLMGQIYAARSALTHMVPQRSGTIVTVSSDAGRVGTNGETIYAAAKGGVIAFTKSLAREVTRFGIRINCVSPGPTRTPALEGPLREQPALVQKMIDLIPMKRIAEPEEPADAVVFFAGGESSYITGQVLSVNGGLNMVG
jgi:NAD(P)-dependent dehydrogenase (short-subunit alcohol dehydrogenase family)